jgi:tetratricopeptide (TPR) repeat protein
VKTATALALTVLSALAGAAGAQGPPTLEHCDELVASAPDQRRSYNCFWYSVRAHGRHDEAVSRLEGILDDAPDHPAALHNLARIEGSRGRERAEELYRRSVDGYAQSGEGVGRIWALLDLTFFLGERGRPDDADETLAIARQVAEELDDDNLRVQVGILGGTQATRRSDYGRALRYYREAEAVAFPDGETGAKQDILGGLGRVASALGRHDEAIEYFEREAELVRSTGNIHREAVTRYNIATEAHTAWLSGLMTREEFDRRVQESLDTAILGGHPTAEASTRLMIARHRQGADSLSEIDAAMELLTETGHWNTRQFAHRLKARKTFDLGPDRRDEAFRLIEETVAQARAAGDFDNAARAMVTRTGMMVETEQRRQTITAFLDLLEGIERLRDIQPEAEIRARYFMSWRSVYQAFVDFLLEAFDAATGGGEDAELAFRTAERARARSLLDALEAADVPRGDEVDHPLEEQRVRALEGISEIQRRLMDPSLPAEQRRDSLERLDTLETEEADLRDRLARLPAAAGSAVVSELAGLSEVRQALDPDQAMLYFELRAIRAKKKLSLPPGPSFVLALSRNGLSRHELPAFEEIASRVGIFTGLLFQGDASLERPAARLYQDLLDEALRALPAEIERLVVVPDGPLHLLPLESLKESGEADPVGARFELSYVPSATAWMRWKRMPDSAAARRVLSLADPALAFSDEGSAVRRKNPWAAGLRVAPLPFARREAKAMAGLGDEGSRLLEGADASEVSLKSVLHAGPLAIVHFGTHAVLDDRHPDRTAVLLTPGDDQEDGLLQMREIVGLDLAGALVILSACSSAAGEQLGGEGVMGLAHAFFRAGARTVVAATHPLRDEETARLMALFARRLGRGASVAEAMTEARRESVADGLPARAWAGLVVLGDGDHRPFRAGTGHRALYWVFAVVLLATGVWWLLKRFGGSRSLDH